MDYQDEAASDIEFSVSYDDYMEIQAQEENEDEQEQMTEEEILKEEDSLLFHNEKF